MAQTVVNQSQAVKDKDGYAGYTFRLEVIMNSYDSASATYNVTINHYAKGDTSTNHKYHGLTTPKSLIKAVSGSTTFCNQSVTVGQITGSEVCVNTWTGTIQANADGNLNITYSANYNANKSSGYLPATHTITSTINMPRIPRYATITSLVVNKRDETSVNVTWAADVVCDYAWYRIRTSNGSWGSWIGGVGTNFNVTGLSPNVEYIVQLKVRRQDSQLVTPDDQAPTARNTTYAYPYCTTMPNFVIGNNVTLEFYNPLGRTFTYEILTSSDTTVTTGTTSTTTSGSITPTANTLYASIPDSTSANYKVKCTYNSNVDTKTGGTYSVNVDTNKPNVSNCAGTYTANLTNLTNNNQTVINNASTVTYTITTGATAQNSATISKYTVTWGSATPVVLTSISTSASLVRGNGNTISVTVEDSRGLTNTFITSISEVITYTTPTSLSISPDRLNGVGEDVYLDVAGTIYYDKFGTNGVSNKITSIKYSIENETAQNVGASLSSLAYSSQSSTNHTQRFSITNAPIFRDSGGTQGFDTTKTYSITVVVTDTSGNTATISGIIKDGKFAMIKGRDSNGDYHTGINGLPDNNYALKVHGSISADNIKDNHPVGSLYFSDNSTSPASLFGGTWEQLNGYYLYAGNGYSKTTYTGKNAQSHTLTANQSGLREHNHGAGGSYSGANFYIRHGNTAGRDVVAPGANTSVEVGVGASWGNGIDMTSYTHNIDRVNIGGTVGVSVNNQGPWDATEGHPHNIATLEVYAWRRTA